MPFERAPVDRRVENASERLPQQGTRGALLGLAASINAPQAVPLQRETLRTTVTAWVHGAQERMRQPENGQRLETALGAVGNLPQSLQSRWRSILTDLRGYTTRRNNDGSTGDPVAVLRHIAILREDRQRLQKIVSLEQTPENAERAREAATAIDAALQSYEQAIGRAHPGFIVENPYAAMRNRTVEERGSNLLRIGVAGAGLGAAAIGGMLAFFAREEDQNWALPGAYLAVAAVAMGWGSLTEKADQRLARQVGFLVEPGGDWERLQFGSEGIPAYDVRGADWALFAEQYYNNGTRNPLIAAMIANKNTPSAQQRRAILDLAPEAIRPQVERMLDSRRENSPGIDMRLFFRELSRATTREAQQMAVQFVRSGATRRNLQALNPGMRTV